MNEGQFYPAIENVDPIISPIVDRFKTANPGFTYDKKFIIYNTNEHPLFKISSIEILMGKTDIIRVIRDDQKKSIDERMYTPGDDFVYGTALVPGSNYKRRAMFFTRSGFQIYLMTSRGDVSNLFRKFLLVVLDELHTKGFVAREDAIRITEEKYKEEIQAITNRLEQTSKVLENEQLKRQEVEAHLVEAEITANQLTIIAGHQEKQLHSAREYTRNMEEDFPSSKEDELRILKMKYLRVIRVYLVPYEKLKKPAEKKQVKKRKPKNKIYEYLSAAKVEEFGLDDTSSDDELNDHCELNMVESKRHGPVLSYTYDMFSTSNPPDFNDAYYYTISATKKLSVRLGIHIGNLYVSSQEHYDGLKTYLMENCPTPIRGVFITSFHEMEDKLRELFIQSNRAAYPI
jgi:hypothetical protein